MSVFVIDRILPDHCFSQSRTFTPEGAVIHYVSVDVGNDWLSDRLEEWQRFDVDTLWNFFVEMNRPMRDWGPIWLRRDSDARMHGSYHRVISLSGDVYQFVPHDKLAYHAGHSWLNGRADCNSWCWGYALIGPAGGTKDSAFTKAQYESLAECLLDDDVLYKNIAGHDAVRKDWKELNAGNPKAKKVPNKPDPGPNFNWTLLNDLMLS